MINTQIVFNNNRVELLWLWDKNHMFSVRTSYQILGMRGVSYTLGSALWKLKISYKVQMFIWLVDRKAILN